MHKLREEGLCLRSCISWDETQAGNLTWADASALGSPGAAHPASNICSALAPRSFHAAGLSCCRLSESKQQHRSYPTPMKLVDVASRLSLNATFSTIPGFSYQKVEGKAIWGKDTSSPHLSRREQKYLMANILLAFD